MDALVLRARATQMADDSDSESSLSDDEDQHEKQRQGAVVRSRPEAPTLLRLSDLVDPQQCANDTAKLDAILANQLLLAKALNVVVASVQDVRQGLTKTRQHLNKHDLRTTSNITLEAAKKWLEEKVIKEGLEGAFEAISPKEKEGFLDGRVYPRLGFNQSASREDREAMQV